MELTGHLIEDHFIAYFSGEMDPERMRKLEKHVENCPPCARQYRVYKVLFAGLVAMLKRGEQEITAENLRAALQQNLKRNQIFYSILHIPDFASVLVAKSNHGVVAVLMGKKSQFEFEERLKSLFPRQWIVESLEETNDARLQLEQYFYRERSDFDLPLDLRLVRTDFQREVLTALQEIPYGHFITYGALAKRIGKPKAVRAIGGALGKNPLPILIPCHRVVAGRGRLGGFSAGIELKLKLLEIEGVRFPHTSRQMDLFNSFED